MLLDIGLIIFFSIVLLWATDLLVGGLNRLARKTRLGKFGLSALLVGLATSLPELFVGVMAAVEGNPELSLGNVLGSNIADLTLIIGGAAVIGGSVRVVGNFLRRDFFTAFLTAAVPLLLLLDGKLGAGDGWLLILVYLVYSAATLSKTVVNEEHKGRWLRQRSANKELLGIIGGAALLLVAADLLVRATQRIGAALGVPMVLMGLVLVAVGTSLPELAFEIKAIRSREAGMVYGNLLGSVVANATLILGVTVVLAPIKLGAGLRSYLVATMAFALVFGVFWLFAYSKKKLERWEGAALVAIYLLFVVVELWWRNGVGH